MSKAFTSEEPEAEPPAGRAPPPPGELRPITRAGHLALEAELQALRRERDEAERQKRASALDAPAHLKTLEQRATLLEALLATVRVVPPAADTSRAAFGHEVEVEDEAGAVHRYTVVGPDEAEARQGRISAASPLGLSLLGCAPGDEVEVERPRGSLRLLVRAVRQPDGRPSP